VSTLLKGNATEAAVLRALVVRDLPVLLPFGEGHPYDLAVDLGDSIVRVQCKTARLWKGCVVFNSRSTDHGRGQGTYIGLADLFGVHSPETDTVFLVPVLDVPTSVVYLRREPARNNQRKGVRLAADYALPEMGDEELLRVLRRSVNPPGPVLSLVEPRNESEPSAVP
jgi:hypothetical protein